MPGFLLHQGAAVMCAHGGQMAVIEPNPRVQVSNMPTSTIAAPWQVTGCPGVPGAVPPCVMGQWVSGTTRVTSNGLPLVVQSGSGITAPGGVPHLPVNMQTRVTAT
jgi:hypothetical protein